MNDQNLIPLNKRPKSEQREIQRQGGIANGKARLAKKHGRELVRAILAMPQQDPEVNKELARLGFTDPELCNEVALHVRQLQKAIRKADTTSYNALLKAAGYTTEEVAAVLPSQLNVIVQDADTAAHLVNLRNKGKK